MVENMEARESRHSYKVLSSELNLRVNLSAPIGK